MNVEQILSQMTLEEKVKICQGADFWHTVGIPRLGIPAMMVSDGPYGLRKQDTSSDHLGINDSIKAVCFPTSVGTAASFDPELLRTLGENLGQSAQAENLGVVLGPAANIKRSPLCGRNFEYISEDPCLSSELAAAYIQGVQSQGVGTSLKHFAANNQETRRMSVSVSCSERAMREIYLASFEGAVTKGKPWTVMCSYNKLYDTYASENPWLLTDVLRKDWGFDGVVMTDWGACNNHAEGVAAGCELEMPRSGDGDDQLLLEAVQSGQVPMEVLDEAARRMLTLISRYETNHREGEVFDRDMQHHMARRIAREAMVLLKNEGDVLPLRGNKKIAFIGKFAKEPRFMGGGSSHINASHVTSALDAVRSVSPVTYAQGYDTQCDQIDPALVQEAVQAAAAADVAVMFLGLPDAFESEGFDRTHLELPLCQTHLLEAVLKVQKQVVVVLHNGAPVTMPWVHQVPAILEAYLGGQACGGAVVDLLFGAVSPCGKLAETFPIKLEDTPSHLNFPGDRDRVEYAEGIYVGYRYYDKKGMEVLFPFGHGLTYTTFRYDNLRLSSPAFTGEDITCRVDVTNTGTMAAKEIVQFYIRPLSPKKDRPIRELKGFGKVELMPGETKTVTATLNRRSFAYWEESIHDWHLEGGKYMVEAAASSRDIRLTAAIEVTGEPLPIYVTTDTTIGDIRTIPGHEPLLQELMSRMPLFQSGENDTSLGEGTADMMEAMITFMPLHAICSFSGGQISRTDMENLASQLNALQGL